MKLKLRIEDLTVASFEATPETPRERGTVQANQSDPNSCYPMVCYSGVDSCLGTCVQEETCGMSCGGTCIAAYCTGEDS
jgi:hypothetical protein